MRTIISAAFGTEMLRLGVWLVLLIAIFVPMERLRALHPRRFLRKGLGTDLAYYFLSGIAPKLLLTIPVGLLVGALHRMVPAEYYSTMSGIPVWLRVPAAMLVGEVGSYWGHRWSHEIPFLWRFHSIHHSAEEIDWLVKSHAHPFDMFFVRFCGLVPMYALGLAQPARSGVDLAPALVTVVGTAWGFFIHANVKWRLGWLEWVVSTPAFHHWHHTNDGPERINKNYAALLPCVDQMFGTLYLPAQQWPDRYGIDGKVPADLPGQILHPLLPGPTPTRTTDSGA